MHISNSNHHQVLLETYFFEEVDQGTPSEGTSLLQGHCKGSHLIDFRHDEFRLSAIDANFVEGGLSSPDGNGHGNNHLTLQLL